MRLKIAWSEKKASINEHKLMGWYFLATSMHSSGFVRAKNDKLRFNIRL